MILNLLNLFAPIINLFTEVLNFLVEKTGSKTTAYASLIIVAVLAFALAVFIFIATIKSIKNKRSKSLSNNLDKNEAKSNEQTNSSESDGGVEPLAQDDAQNLPNDDAGVNEPENKQEKVAERKAVRDSSRLPKYDDGIPAMPIYRKSKFEKPRTILVKKDKSKLRNGSDNK